MGADYVACKNDNPGTFQRVVAIDDDALLIAALNQAAFPVMMVVARQDIARIGG